MNTLQKEFFVERLLHSVLDVTVPWFIMVITYTPKKGLEKSKSEDTSVQIVTVHMKKTVVFGRILRLYFLIRFNDFFKLLRSHNVSHEGISAVMDFIYPRSKSTILREFSKNMEQENVSHDENVRIVCYDEQHPKKGRCQKYRLTLLDPKTQRPLADELFDDKSSETIKNFLKKQLDTSEPVFIVTDFDKRYPEILREVFGDKLVHQYCLMHLNKLVVQ